MASTMQQFTANNSAWTKVANNATTVLLQRQNMQPIKVFTTAAGDSAPTDTVLNTVGMILQGPNDTYGRSSNTAVDVYVRTLQSNTICVVVSET